MIDTTRIIPGGGIAAAFPAAMPNVGASGCRRCRARPGTLAAGLSRLLPVLVAALCGLPAPAPAAAQNNDDWLAKLVSVQGSVEIMRRGGTSWVPAESGATLAASDLLRVGPHSRAALLLHDQAVIRLDQNTTVTFKQDPAEGGSLLELLKGALHFFSTDPSHLKVITPFVNAAIEGTEFVIRVAPEQTELSVLEGKIRADNAFGSLLVEPGQSAVAAATRPPRSFLVLKPRDAVHWSLYYPPVIDLDALAAVGAERAPAAGTVPREAYEIFLTGGNTRRALDLLDTVPEDRRDTAFRLCRSAILTAAGAVAEAEAELAAVLAEDPREPTALALQAVIALAQDDKEKAGDLADRAMQADPASAAAAMAQSYVSQAQFDNDQAGAIIRSLVARYPQNALGWARLSDLELGRGRLEAALQAAARAAALNPELAMVHTVLGFAQLAQIRIDRARESFALAIRLNPVDPLPRLGLGLTEIRGGDLAAGREHLEIAVALDPLSSLLRSYLGKAYYEEKRDAKAGDQLGIAKGLDPNDPTPWFYDAILKQSLNRPVEALRDLEESIARNDNRAVYRSRLLLDQDLAARSAGLARIYGDLGFQQRALVEGWRSVNTDPGNFSAHRFLADSYSALPRHEIARVSELLQAQLLQPINLNPVQPQLAESDLGVLQGTGPAQPGFNEYNWLFNQNRTALQVSTVFGENATIGDEVVLSGVQNQVSFSLGQYHYQTQGFRENDDLTRNITNAFTQVSLTPNTSLQAEYRYSGEDSGDLSLLFNPDFYSQNQRNEDRTDSFRLGLHHAFSPDARFLGSLSYRDLDATFSEQLMRWLAMDLEGSDSGWQGEGQFQWQGASADWIVGAGGFDGSSTDSTRYSLTVDGWPTWELPSREDREDLRHASAYGYSLIHALDRRLTVTLGAAFDHLSDEDMEEDQWEPKFGLSFDLDPATTLRAAAFRTLKRPLVANQTIEPTQVAGFNQFFDDPNGTSVWTYGIALDRRLRADLFAGIEFSKRELDDVPLTIHQGTSESLSFSSWHEQVARAYLYWAARNWLSLTLEAQVEDFDRPLEDIGTEYFTELTTVKVPLGIHFFHPSGIGFQVRTTLVNQDGVFIQDQRSGPEDDSDTFLIMDLALNYRLPRRLGMITFGVRNLWDQQFHFQDTDPANPDIYPGRLIYSQITLVF